MGFRSVLQVQPFRSPPITALKCLPDGRRSWRLRGEGRQGTWTPALIDRLKTLASGEEFPGRSFQISTSARQRSCSTNARQRSRGRPQVPVGLSGPAPSAGPQAARGVTPDDGSSAGPEATHGRIPGRRLLRLPRRSRRNRNPHPPADRPSRANPVPGPAPLRNVPVRRSTARQGLIPHPHAARGHPDS
jgi:hypothetical protein